MVFELVKVRRITGSEFKGLVEDYTTLERRDMENENKNENGNGGNVEHFGFLMEAPPTIAQMVNAYEHAERELTAAMARVDAASRELYQAEQDVLEVTSERDLAAERLTERLGIKHGKKATKATKATSARPAERVYEYVRTHDGCTRDEIGKGLGLSAHQVAGSLSKLLAAERVAREDSAAGVAHYGVQ